ncbi:MAG: hypothetical protein DRH08_07085 [Deltaproteobacteria bacterium]|nr:MAG: hypothetical protein DRH08_07085 [Deltaproteobacteria bacterium]
MKFKLTKEQYNETSESVKSLYKEVDGTYILDVDISESDDFQRLLKNKNDILDEKKTEEQKRLALEDQNEQDHIKNLEEKQEYEKLLGIKEEKFKNELQKERDSVVVLKKQIETSMLDSAVNSLSSSLAGDRADLMRPHIRSRMVMKEVDGEQKLFITDVTGTASAMTVEQLEKEFNENELFSPILKGRQSSGGNSDNNGQGGGASDFTEQEKYFMHETRNLTKQAELMKENPELYKQLSTKYNIGTRANMFRGRM